jgi:hypothetical protein
MQARHIQMHDKDDNHVMQRFHGFLSSTFRGLPLAQTCQYGSADLAGCFRWWPTGDVSIVIVIHHLSTLHATMSLTPEQLEQWERDG